MYSLIKGKDTAIILKRA